MIQLTTDSLIVRWCDTTTDTVLVSDYDQYHMCCTCHCDTSPHAPMRWMSIIMLHTPAGLVQYSSLFAHQNSIETHVILMHNK